jgi:hypothetical protein
MVLDGALDPNISVVEQSVSQAKGFDEALDAFLADCAKQDDCPLPKNKEEASAKIIALFASSAITPFPRKTKVENCACNTNAIHLLSLLSKRVEKPLTDTAESWKLFLPIYTNVHPYS